MLDTMSKSLQPQSKEQEQVQMIISTLLDQNRSLIQTLTNIVGIFSDIIIHKITK